MKITLFGLAGAGTSSVAYCLAKKLNISFISSGEIFREFAKEKNLDIYAFSALCQQDPTYDQKIDQFILSLNSSNFSYVIDSRMAWYFLRDSVKIHLQCDLNQRILRISEREGLPFEDSMQKTLARESNERKRYLSLYGVDYIKQNNFDLKINTTNLTVDQTVEKIVRFVSSL